MKERPILFSTPMVKAILAGKKSVTRRVVTFKSAFADPHRVYKSVWEHPGGGWAFSDCAKKPKDWEPHCKTGIPCPYGVVGDRLWVKESFGKRWHHAQPPYFYKATDDLSGHPDFDGWKSGRFMPRAAARLILEVTSVSVERLQAVTPLDILAEGVVDRTHFNDVLQQNLPVSAVDGVCYLDLHSLWRKSWDKINGKRAGCAWADNPWVWVVAFRRPQSLEVPSSPVV